MKKEITRFINEELKPRLYDYVPQIFPTHKFTRKGNKYVSSLHADGTEGSGPKADRSVITEREPFKVFDNTKQEARDIISLFMELNGITEVWEAVNRLCDIVGIDRPEDTPEARERYKQRKERETLLEASVKKQQAALFTPEGRAVLDYLHGRGWTDGEIKEAGLGYITPKEAAAINAQRSIGDFYTLSILLYSGGTIYGIKFRTIQAETGGQDKYTYLHGTTKKEFPFNLTARKQEAGEVVVVEGELDALHAKVKGISGVVATGGGKLTGELLDVVVGRGIKRITLLFDRDARGEKFVRESIDIAHKRGVSVLVATFPEGERLKSGKPIHDIDEFLQAHTPEELRALIGGAVSGSKYLLEAVVRDVLEKYGEGERIPEGVELDLREKVIQLANHTPNEIERETVLTYYAKIVNIDGSRAFSEDALRAVADRERAAEDTLRIKEKTGEAIGRALDLYKEKKDVQGALREMGEAVAEIKLIGDREKFGDLLRVPTREERLAKFKETGEALQTWYKFTEGGDDLPLTIPAGALTIIAAPTSHGKSTFLRNLALNVARIYKTEENSILYFTFEECEEEVVAQFTNTALDMELHAPSGRHPQTETIAKYFKGGEDPLQDPLQYVSADKRAEFVEKEARFSRDYLESGKIRIFYKDYDLETLLEALEFAVRNIHTKAVFIDYIQILRSQKYNRQPRAEQLKDICICLKNFAVNHGLPVVLAAQLNREAATPLRMDNAQMAESSDIEKAANTIICLWNSAFKPALYGGREPSGDEKNEILSLEGKGFKLGQDGKIFARITKKRGSRGRGMYAIFNYKGYTGKIQENDKPGEQMEIPFPKQGGSVHSFYSQGGEKLPEEEEMIENEETGLPF